MGWWCMADCAVSVQWGDTLGGERVMVLLRRIELRTY